MTMTLLRTIATCNSNDLKDAVNLASSVLIKNQSPILNTILLEVIDGDLSTLRVCGYGGGIATRVKVSLLSSCEPFAICIPVIGNNSFKDYLKVITGDISLEYLEDYKLKISTNCGGLTLNGRNPEEFPAKTENDIDMDGVRFTMSAEYLVPAFKSCLEHSSTDYTKQVLTSVNMSLSEQTKNQLQLLGTDGHRLCRFRLSTNVATDFNWNIERKVLETLLKYVDAKTHDITFTYDSSGIIRINCEDLTIISNLYVGEYPATKTHFANFDNRKDDQILPDMVAKIQLDRKRLISLVDRMRIFTTYGKNNLCQLHFDFKNNTLRVFSSPKNEYGCGEETMDISASVLEGHPSKLSVCFNIEYFRDSLQHLHGTDLFMHLESNVRPVFLEPCLYNEEQVFLVMPIQPRQF